MTKIFFTLVLLATGLSHAQTSAPNQTEVPNCFQLDDVVPNNFLIDLKMDASREEKDAFLTSLETQGFYVVHFFKVSDTALVSHLGTEDTELLQALATLKKSVDQGQIDIVRCNRIHGN